jgi:hypothetical protein
MRLLPLVAWLALLVGCTSKTEYGPCIGAFDDPDPALRYRTEGWNIAMAVIFVEMVVPPIIVIANETRCPVGRRAP